MCVLIVWYIALAFKKQNVLESDPHLFFHLVKE